MRGVENIVRMRMAGKRPEFVTIEISPMQAWTHIYTDKPGRFLDIHMSDAEADAVARVDLRCLTGLIVVVNGEVSSRVENVAKAALNAGAKTVHYNVFNTENPYRIQVVSANCMGAPWQQ